MNLLQLKANNFRNLTTLDLDFNPAFNLFYGANGSGKSSILEAIYFLGLGRSFRTSLVSRVIQYNSDALTVFGSFKNSAQLQTTTGIEKSRSGKIKIKVGNEIGASLAELARLLPLQLLNPNSHSLIETGPKTRREFIDWGVFHVEPQFFSLWQRFQRALKQRNLCLQQNLPEPQVRAWDGELILSGQAIAAMRENYLRQLIPLIHEILQQLNETRRPVLTYYRGWDENLEFSEVLGTNFRRDIFLGYTQYGAQRADLVIKLDEMPAQDILSRGEQKLLVIAMRLAQGMLLQNLGSKKCVYLLDDLGAELDESRKSKVFQVLAQLEAQVFLTGVEASVFENLVSRHPVKLFHVEHGTVDVTGG